METTSQVKLIAITKPVVEDIPTPEALVAYCARVSNPTNQGSHDTAKRLLDFCKRNGHWSIFQMVNAVVEIHTPRDIARQFTRHESMSVVERDIGLVDVKHDGFNKHAGGLQEFSQRYAAATDYCEREMRLQDHHNRQNSIDTQQDPYWERQVEAVKSTSKTAYDRLLNDGVAKECARVVLPEGLVMSRLYVNGTLRSWMHFIDTRTTPGTQKEHRELAEMCRDVLVPEFPSALGV